MAQQLSPLRLLLSLLLLWSAACRYTESEAKRLEKATPFATNANGASIRNADDIEFNVNVSDADVAGDGDDIVGAAGKTTVVGACFDTFILDIQNVSNTYALTHLDCLDLGRARRLRLAGEQLPKREDMTAAMTEICTHFRDCSELESDLAFFRCNSKNSYKNVNTLMQIYLNSSAAIVELDEKYEETEKEMLTCTIAAKEQYFNATFNAYLRLSKCLKTS